MADLTNIKAVRDGSVELTYTNGSAAQTVVADCADEKVIIIVNNTDATTARVAVAAGTGIRSALGDVKVDVAQNKVRVLGPFEGMRVRDMTTGKITVNITGTDDAAFGGTITNVKVAAVQLP
jgi:hypothetical protein